MWCSGLLKSAARQWRKAFLDPTRPARGRFHRDRIKVKYDSFYMVAVVRAILREQRPTYRAHVKSFFKGIEISISDSRHMYTWFEKEFLPDYIETSEDITNYALKKLTHALVSIEAYREQTK